MRGPKILVYDIETAPILAYVWGLWDQNIALNHIVSDWHLLSWSAKWLHEDKVMYMDQRGAKDISNDKAILQKLWALLDEADIVVTQNGKAFDEKKLNARFIHHKMKPPSSYKHIDTKIIAKSKFGFTSNKLEFLAKALGTRNRKMTVRKFDGFELWKECLRGNIKAWKEMEKYNRLDVLTLEEVYKRLIPWHAQINFEAYTDDKGWLCSCGSRKFVMNGHRYTAKGKFSRYKCTKCGAEKVGSTNLLSKEKMREMLK